MYTNDKRDIKNETPDYGWPKAAALPKLGKIAFIFSSLGTVCWLGIFLSAFLLSRFSDPVGAGSWVISVILILAGVGLLLLLIGFFIGVISIENSSGKLAAGLALFVVIGLLLLWRQYGGDLPDHS